MNGSSIPSSFYRLWVQPSDEVSKDFDWSRFPSVDTDSSWRWKRYKNIYTSNIFHLKSSSSSGHQPEVSDEGDRFGFLFVLHEDLVQMWGCPFHFWHIAAVIHAIRHFLLFTLTLLPFHCISLLVFFCPFEWDWKFFLGLNNNLGVVFGID